MPLPILEIARKAFYIGQIIFICNANSDNIAETKATGGDLCDLFLQSARAITKAQIKEKQSTMLQNFPTNHLLHSLLLMALTSFLPHSSAAVGEHHHRKAKHHHQPLITLSSWDHLKALLSCKTSAPTQVQDPSSSSATSVAGKKSKLRSSWTPSNCDVVHVRTRVFHRSDQVTGTGPFSCSSALGETYPLRRRPADSGAHRGGSQLIRFSGCYECHAVEAEPSSRFVMS
ncbi:hypothetical protein KSP40_PGU005594 [Platanthera guangdongensis]|uniref:Uncharacterized protein n=1 Tax=Platanthera guangdongensis TaxID=2320717 RepID=A0ABR2M002_9ASPA